MTISFGQHRAIWTNILNNIHGSTDSWITRDKNIRGVNIGPPYIWSKRKADIIIFNLNLWSNSDHSDAISWAPLLGNRSGPESSLWWKITHFHAPILLKISSTEKSIELCSTKSWRLFFEIWRSEQRNIFVKLKLFGYFFWAV